MPAKDLYYIALIPPEPVHSWIHELKLQISEAYGSRQALKSPPHITLISPFRTEEDHEKEIRALMEAHEPEEPIRVTLKDFNHFKGKVLFIHVNENSALSALQYSLEEDVRERKELFNYNYDPRPWHPHITLGFRDWDKKQFQRALADFEGRRFRAEFEIEELFLLKHNGKTWDVVE